MTLETLAKWLNLTRAQFLHLKFDSHTCTTHRAAGRTEWVHVRACISCGTGCVEEISRGLLVPERERPWQFIRKKEDLSQTICDGFYSLLSSVGPSRSMAQENDEQNLRWIIHPWFSCEHNTVSCLLDGTTFCKYRDYTSHGISRTAVNLLSGSHRNCVSCPPKQRLSGVRS